MNRLNEIEARANAATEGPWNVFMGRIDHPGRSLVAVAYDVGCDVDAEFIAHARTDVPWLLEQVERRDKALEAVLDLHKEDGHGWGPGESFCTECQQGYGLLVPYPCPTVAAIRQHLGDDL